MICASRCCTSATLRPFARIAAAARGLGEIAVLVEEFKLLPVPVRCADRDANGGQFVAQEAACFQEVVAPQRVQVGIGQNFLERRLGVMGPAGCQDEGGYQLNVDGRIAKTGQHVVHHAYCNRLVGGAPFDMPDVVVHCGGFEQHQQLARYAFCLGDPFDGGYHVAARVAQRVIKQVGGQFVFQVVQSIGSGALKIGLHHVYLSG